MTQVVCDYWGKVIKEPFSDYRGDLDSKNLAVIEIKPTLLNQTTKKIENPDLCRECIIKVLRGKKCKH
ncbi:MAG: hypothetical protein ACFFCM_16490 [Promethearchaeota archaeon]